MDVLDKIFYTMKLQDISDAELARRIGLARSAITDWRTGKTTSYKRHISKIAKALGVEPEYLLKDTDCEYSESNFWDSIHKIFNDSLAAANSDLSRVGVYQVCFCRKCGGKLTTAYYESRLYAVTCKQCETVTLVKANNPYNAACKCGIEDVKPLTVDGTEFNTDTYCPHCGRNLTDYCHNEMPRIMPCPSCGGYIDKNAKPVVFKLNRAKREE